MSSPINSPVNNPDYLSDLVNRLRGIYTIPVDDGAGLLDGKPTFTRRFEVSPISSEAADVVEALVETLRERCFSTGGRREFKKQGFSLMIDEETAIRDINYRDAVLFPTADEAVAAALASALAEKRAVS